MDLDFIKLRTNKMIIIKEYILKNYIYSKRIKNM